jgi:hypothetical protein
MHTNNAKYALIQPLVSNPTALIIAQLRKKIS